MLRYQMLGSLGRLWLIRPLRYENVFSVCFSKQIVLNDNANLGYFKSLTRNRKEIQRTGKFNKSYLNSVDEATEDEIEEVSEHKNCETENNIVHNIEEKVEDVLRNYTTNIDMISRETLSSLKPVPKTAGNLAAFVHQSTVLQSLVRLGVDLSEVEKNKEATEKIIKMGPETEMKPVLFFLKDTGLATKDMAKLISKNPLVLCEKLDDLKLHVEYLQEKKFKCIGRIISKAPMFLTKPMIEIDSRLGFLQKVFKLTGNEIRKIVVDHPKIVTFPLKTIKEMKMTLRDVLDFTHTESKQMLINHPKLYLSDKYATVTRFNYLVIDMGIRREAIVNWPNILRTRQHRVKERHLFLKSIKRDQYDLTLPNYVSPEALVSKNDAHFCKEVAKVPVFTYNEFLKTL